MRLNDKALTFVTGLVLICGVGGFVHMGDKLFSPKQPEIQLAKAPTKTDAITSKYNTAVPLEAIVVPAKTPIEFDTDIELVRANTPANANTFKKQGVALNYKPLPLDCTVKLSAQSLRSARVRLNITAPCHSNKVATIAHAGLQFNEYVNDNGNIEITIPVLLDPATIEVSFSDGIKKSITTQTKDLSKVTRTGIAWSGHNTLNMQVHETANNPEKNQHLSLANKRTADQSYFLGGGYLTTLGNPDIPNGKRIHIYTSDVTQNRYVGFQLHMKKQGLACQNDLSLRTIHYAPSTGIQIAKKSTTIDHCKAHSGNIVLKNMLKDMIVAQNN